MKSKFRKLKQVLLVYKIRISFVRLEIKDSHQYLLSSEYKVAYLL